MKNNGGPKIKTTKQAPHATINTNHKNQPINNKLGGYHFIFSSTENKLNPCKCQN